MFGRGVKGGVSGSVLTEQIGGQYMCEGRTRRTNVRKKKRNQRAVFGSVESTA